MKRFQAIWTNLKMAIGCAAVVLNAGCSKAPAVPSSTTLATTANGVTIYGEMFVGDLGTDAPLILLFHQGGSNGRGEYAALAPWLNRAGFRAIAWDLRAGGDMFGEVNRTVAGLPPGTAAEFCDAYSDLLAALNHVTSQGLAERVVVWGSSYTGSLVFRLAAENPREVTGVMAFSPASGGPMADCRARIWIGRVTAPVIVLRPASEMVRETSVEQHDILTAAGATFHVVENGVHGSSMLVDVRTGHDMSEARAAVIEWLTDVTGQR